MVIVKLRSSKNVLKTCNYCGRENGITKTERIKNEQKKWKKQEAVHVAAE